MEAIPIQPNAVRAETIRWLGGWHPLVRQIAPGEGFAQPDRAAAARPGRPLTSAAALRDFLRTYRSEVLLPCELPVVGAAARHVVGGEFLELIQLDRHLASAGWLQRMAESSRRAGRAHLSRLEPLRDHRGLRKYRRAVDAGEAHGWHAVVAGLALGLYSLPLRQGLLDYALHVVWNALEQAAGPAGLSAEQCHLLAEELSQDLAADIQRLVPASGLVAV